jgi:hypothetical protein
MVIAPNKKYKSCLSICQYHLLHIIKIWFNCKNYGFSAAAGIFDKGGLIAEGEAKATHQDRQEQHPRRMRGGSHTCQPLTLWHIEINSLLQTNATK